MSGLRSISGDGTPVALSRPWASQTERSIDERTLFDPFPTPVPAFLETHRSESLPLLE